MVLWKYAWLRWCKWTWSNVAHLCGEGASGWKAQICPSSTPARPPLTVAGTPGDCRWKNRFAKGKFSQTILGAERCRVWRFPPRSRNKKRIGIPGPSCWTRGLTVDRADRCWTRRRRSSRVSLQRPRHQAPNLQLCWRSVPHLRCGLLTNGPAAFYCHFIMRGNDKFEKPAVWPRSVCPLFDSLASSGSAG